MGPACQVWLKKKKRRKGTNGLREELGWFGSAHQGRLGLGPRGSRLGGLARLTRPAWRAGSRCGFAGWLGSCGRLGPTAHFFFSLPSCFLPWTGGLGQRRLNFFLLFLLILLLLADFPVPRGGLLFTVKPDPLSVSSCSLLLSPSPTGLARACGQGRGLSGGEVKARRGHGGARVVAAATTAHVWGSV